MNLHLFWIDNKWKKNGGTAKNYNLIIDMENKTYKIFVNPFYGYEKPEDIEVKRKNDIIDYATHLSKNGFKEVDKI